MDLILEDLKGDPEFNINLEVPKEEEFRDKWPYTLI